MPVIPKRATKQESGVKKKKTKNDALLIKLTLYAYPINSIKKNEWMEFNNNNYIFPCFSYIKLNIRNLR
jgi:hypothetical protein